MQTNLVLDTNILLLDAHNVYTLGNKDTVVVLPETVIDEADSKKSGTSEIAYQARELGRLLTKATQVSTFTIEDLVVTKMRLYDVTICIIASKVYPNFKDTEPNIINDRKIIEIAVQLKEVYKNPVKFMSNDVMCRIRANSLDIDTCDLKTVDNIEGLYTKEITVDSDTFPRLKNIPITEVDPNYSPENFNYVFTDSYSGQVKLATVHNGSINIIGRNTETELRKQYISPLNSGQLFLSAAIQNPYTDIVIVESKAGSGKTAVSISNALRLISLGKYSSLTYVRASVDDVDKAEEIGFLSGNEEKKEVYLHPLEDTLDFIARQKLKASKLKGAELEEAVTKEIDTLKAKYHIQPMIGLGMRGRTFTDTIAIIDEAQNMSKSSLQKVLTRFGKNCKIIVIGSNKQIDNSYITKYTNGLSVLLDACCKEHDIKLHAVPLHKIVRSPIAEFAENIFTERK